MKKSHQAPDDYSVLHRRDSGGCALSTFAQSAEMAWRNGAGGHRREMSIREIAVDPGKEPITSGLFLAGRVPGSKRETPDKKEEQSRCNKKCGKQEFVEGLGQHHFARRRWSPGGGLNFSGRNHAIRAREQRAALRRIHRLVLLCTDARVSMR